MVMYLPPRSSSAGMRSVRRELQRRRSKPLAPTRSVGKKPSASPPPRQGSSDAVRDPRHRPPHQEIPPSTVSHSRDSTGTDASPQSRPRASSRCVAASPPPPRSVPSSAGSASRATPGVAALLRPGTVVGVRTRTTKLKTGQVLVLWLKATVVSSSSTHGGYEVVYDGNRPSSDPKGTVRVRRHHVRVIKTSPSPTTPPPSLPPPTAAQKKETLPAARPTTAGKSVRVIRSLLPEMERQARASLSGIGY
ncbi:hypothetical protein SORBI_3002G305300 [Sorghum bicolor]|uniref:Uncharacterized protein n=1 Tax=Sorghum bicolor TaxID=4558 RepID=A0A1B6QEA1_SORBI|nr:hypothetical protein SORBI_3002G305300 [Sorghum bicolor]